MTHNNYEQLYELKRRTMRRVYGMWFMRRVLPGLSLEMGVLALVVLGMQNFLKFGHIINNVLYRVSHHPVGKLGDFWLAAFANTEFITIAMLASGLVFGSLMIRDVVRATVRFRGNLLRPERVT